MDLRAMKIVSITTAVDYADYLRWSLASLSYVVDAAVVVTQPEDAAIDVCSKLNATAFIYEGWHEKGAKFNKAGAIRAAQEIVYQAEPDAWYLLVDADVVVNRDCREQIRLHATDPNVLYGARRLDYHTRDEILASTPTKVYGGMFAGYFQLHKRHAFYPEWSSSAARCDQEFASQFDACISLPFAVHHMGCEGVNWNGRRSPLWRQIDNG